MRYTEEELARLHREAEEELKKIPGVVSVGFGVKESSGNLTDEIAFRVYVHEKKNKEDLPPEEIIPSEINGFKTDVLVLPKPISLACDDLNHYDPLIGGITIVNFRENAQGLIDRGTLGCFGTINGSTSKNNKVFLTNNHVVTWNGGAKGDTIYQPKFTMVNGNATYNPEEKYPIGEIYDVGLQNNYPYKYPEDASAQNENYFVDCAAVKIDTCYSTCCGTNCGVSFSEKNEINNLRYNDTDGNNTIKGIGRVRRVDILDDSVQPPRAKDYFVWKVGRATGRTKGRVIQVDSNQIELDGRPLHQDRVMIIICTDSEPCNAARKFSDRGDSGSVIVNQDGNVVGLLYGGNLADQREGFACHIHPVLDKLKITLISDKRSPDPHNRVLSSDTSNNFSIAKARAETLRSRLVSNERGSEIYHAFESCREEVVWLVNRRRPVTVAWQRNQGPAFVSYFVNTASDPVPVIPQEIKGISLHTLLNSMKEILKLEGSGKLKRTIVQYENLVMTLSQECNNLEDFVNRLTSDAMI
ncbi:MAG: hypothetical protein J7604_06740 [Sporocytophaga sp.]|uniref:hypothetical protein n=1 Tax=Sporocytophaga sp. TaxID=2231183 RepID=UPI001B05DD70|nr:hypothetical protein [Sporocytophaga sp.]MBO9699891.1 hypothetical protein [Sporocytophaga sp.]